ncbi:hypothetical protein [Streptomyces sp. NPDC012888]|uniref:hypothetical protein n=1 Tax=Streptomyces sp. NPDC012888 TaxID=3364855 RepID=UPI00367D000C
MSQSLRNDQSEYDPIDSGEFAWCFSHGRLHRFAGTDEPWCTAHWAPLTGKTEVEACLDKATRFGSAQFIDGLTGEQQLALIDSHRARRADGQ